MRAFVLQAVADCYLRLSKLFVFFFHVYWFCSCLGSCAPVRAYTEIEVLKLLYLSWIGKVHYWWNAPSGEPHSDDQAYYSQGPNGMFVAYHVDRKLDSTCNMNGS